MNQSVEVMSNMKKYTDDAFVSYILAIDFLDDTKYAQPLIYKKMRKAQGPSFKPPDQQINQPAVVSIADELSKLASQCDDQDYEKYKVE